MEIKKTLIICGILIAVGFLFNLLFGTSLKDECVNAIKSQVVYDELSEQDEFIKAMQASCSNEENAKQIVEIYRTQK